MCSVHSWPSQAKLQVIGHVWALGQWEQPSCSLSRLSPCGNKHQCNAFLLDHECSILWSHPLHFFGYGSLIHFLFPRNKVATLICKQRVNQKGRLGKNIEGKHSGSEQAPWPSGLSWDGHFSFPRTCIPSFCVYCHDSYLSSSLLSKC